MQFVTHCAINGDKYDIDQSIYAQEKTVERQGVNWCSECQKHNYGKHAQLHIIISLAAKSTK